MKIPAEVRERMVELIGEDFVNEITDEQLEFHVGCYLDGMITYNEAAFKIVDEHLKRKGA